MQSKYSTPFLSFSSVETHSFDGQTYLYKGQEGWVVVWQGAEVEGGPFKTRQMAREHINALKVLES